MKWCYCMEKQDLTLHISNPVIFTCYSTILSRALHTHMTKFHIIQILETRDTTSDDLYACISVISFQRTAPTALQPQKTCQLHNP